MLEGLLPIFSEITLSQWLLALIPVVFAIAIERFFGFFSAASNWILARFKPTQKLHYETEPGHKLQDIYTVLSLFQPMIITTL